MDRRQLLRGAAVVAAGTAITEALPTVANASPGTADLIIHNGRVLILDKHFRTAEAVAIRGGRVLAVGSGRDIRRYQAPRQNCSTRAAARCFQASTTHTTT
ncbi:twin-arginine translocation signal domain-containing protein [Actinocrispum wychmicini]|uniref:TAT (Twin-arginine translocation) pathway-exported protein n=1 Tax=Actinocrispum wychmicini TaxID=1213861 RepID=A0A4V2S826_9PSEU|nr:twin-arginine translocation signal domain-containing protein [Actinocrispum wychmicini]TCO62230.1 TAT (twin-arginine translocation) pathway-exported protein [Actinocrispum wychmicini]